MTLRTAVFACFTLSGLAANGQTPAPSGPPAPAIVHLDVSMPKGTAEVTLPPNSIQVTDKGKSEQVLFVHKNVVPAIPAPAGEFSNRSEPPLPHLTTVVFDMMRLTQPDYLDTWKLLKASVPQMESAESVYFYVLNLEGNLVPIHAIGSPAAENKTWTQEFAANLDKVMKASSHNRPSQMSDEENVKKTYVALESIANQMAATPGRKDIVWVTGGIAYITDMAKSCNGDWVDCGLYVAHLVVTLDRDHVAIDPLGVGTGLSADTNRDMEYAAGITGGRPYYREDVKSVIQKIGEEYDSTYSIYYMPGSGSFDSTFHKLRVAGPSGVLYTKERYYAIPDSRTSAQKQRADLLVAFNSPRDERQIGLTLKVTPGTPGKSVGIDLQIDPKDLLMREDGGKFVGGLTLLIANSGASGNIGEPMIKSFDLGLTPEQHATVMKGAIPVSLPVPITDATKNVRVIILDQTTGNVGSITVPVSGTAK